MKQKDKKILTGLSVLVVISSMIVILFRREEVTEASSDEEENYVGTEVSFERSKSGEFVPER